MHQGVLYGGRESYHHMCRYFSGFFQHHPLLADIDFYWRVEPDVHFFCDLGYDPFHYMDQQCVPASFLGSCPCWVLHPLPARGLALNCCLAGHLWLRSCLLLHRRAAAGPVPVPH